LLARPAA